MATLEEIITRRDQLNARIRDIQQRERQKSRKARNHALMVMGGMLETACGGDWTAIDFRALDRAIHDSAELLMATRTEEGRDVETATVELRNFEKWKHEMSRTKCTGCDGE